ncbi:MAG: hypothetical protein ABIE07_09770 [Candidatus Zixiibacteriota bacterium]
MVAKMPGMALRELSSDAIREMAKKYAAYMATFRAEIIKEGLSELEASALLDSVAHSCGDGFMRTASPLEMRTLDQ